VVYVNLLLDTILLNEEVLRDLRRPEFCHALTGREVVGKIRYLAISDHFEGAWNWWVDDEGLPPNLIHNFTGLEELILVIGGPPLSEREDFCLAFTVDVKKRLEGFLGKIVAERVKEGDGDMEGGKAGKWNAVPRVKTSWFYLATEKGRLDCVWRLREAETEEEEMIIARGNLKDWDDYFVRCLGHR
jgi:hypothetical protein